MKLLKEIFKRPVTIIFIILISIILGIFSTSNMSINLLPDISFPYLCVQTVYVGADAETINKDVTTPLEKSLNELSDLHSIQTYSIDNASIVILQFDYGVSLDEKQDELEEKINSVSLPSSVTDPVITTVDLNGTSIVSLCLIGSTDFSKTSEKAIELSNSLKSIAGVGDVSISGNPTNTIEITPINGLEILAGALVQYLSYDASLDIPLGEIESEYGKISINNESSAKTIEEIGNLYISTSLDSNIVSVLNGIKEAITILEECNSEELKDLKDDFDNITSYIEDLNVDSESDVEILYNEFLLIKDIVSLIENNSSNKIRSIWDNSLKTELSNPEYINYSKEELTDLSSELDISYSILKYLQDNYSNSESYWNEIYNFKKNNKYTLELDYSELFYNINIVPTDSGEVGYLSDDNIDRIVTLSKYIDESEYSEILNVLLDTGSESLTDLRENSISSDLLKIVTYLNDSNLEENYQIFYEYKLSHEHYEEKEDKYVGDSIPSSDFIYLYNQMTFEEDLGIKPTERLLDFIRNTTFDSTNTVFKLSDVADVSINSTYETKALFNGVDSCQLDIYGASGANTTSIASEALKIIEEFNENNSSFKAIMINNQSEFITDSLSNALVSLLIGMVLAILVIYLFLRKIKSSFIIAISMPLSVLLTMICLNLMGITLNMVSVGGLAVGIGMLVDNSIVVLESITTEHSKGKDVLTASVDGVKLVIGSLIGSTLTSIAVFFPILCISGLTKEIFQDLSWAVIFSLSFSLLVAVTVIPTLFCLFYKKSKPTNEFENEGKTFNKFKNWYGRVLNKFLRHKGLVVISALGIFILSILLVFTFSIEFLPSIDQKKIEVNISYSSQDDADYCSLKTSEAYSLIYNNIENINYVSMNVGYDGLIETNLSGTITLELTDDSISTTEVVEEIRELLVSNNFDESYQVREIDGVVASLTGSFAGISVSITGDDSETLKEIAKKVEEKVLEKDGIVNASDNLLSTSTSYKLNFNKEAISNKGLDYSTIVQTLRVGLAGYTVNTLEESNMDVIVKFNSNTIGEYYDSLGSMIVGFDINDNIVYLSDICDIKEETGRHVIRKINGLDEVTITVESYGIDTNTGSNYLKQVTKEVLKDYDGYTFSTGGVSSYLTDAFSGLVVALIISFFLLFGIMACLFESLRKPLIIIFSFPFAFVGGFIALGITNVSLNVVSFIGLIMLMGVIVNDAIVLNERIDQLRQDGLSNKDAVINGCKDRFRAVLMTTLTTVLALIPMALGIGKGGELMQPLGIVAIGGMTLGTIVTLVLIPSVYCIMYKINFKEAIKNE